MKESFLVASCVFLCEVIQLSPRKMSSIQLVGRNSLAALCPNQLVNVHALENFFPFSTSVKIYSGRDKRIKQ